MKNYEITITLHAYYNQENITKILERGSRKGFVYFDHILAEKYELEAPQIIPSKAAEKVIEALKNNIEGGPAVYTIIEPQCSAYLWFYNFEEQFLQFTFGGFSYPQKKEGYVNFSHYIRMALDVVEDFPIIELKTNMF